MVFVVKVKHGDILRRFTFESQPRGEDLSYSVLEGKIRRLFNLPSEKQIRVTYSDRDGDVITMADDHDLVDALIMQSLNPLRLHVTEIERKSPSLDVIPAASVAPAAESEKRPEEAKGTAHEVPFKHIMKVLNPESLKQAYEPILRGAGASPRQLNDMVEQIVKTVGTQVQHAVKGVEEKSRSVGEVLSGLSDVTKAGSAPVSALPLPFPVKSLAPSVKVEGNNETAEPKSAGSVLHNGVQCDVCGVCPIAGTRFKSAKKHDYDLCCNCFNEADDQAGYTRIDRPLFRPRHLHHMGPVHPTGSGRMRCPALDSSHQPGRYVSMQGPYASRLTGRWYPCTQVQSANAMYAGKLDSRFVEDVTIMDGTEMAPGTRFTKIWRLRNSGKVPWAPQTKLVHVGGDELGSVFVVPLELPEQGLFPEKEVEAAVDLIAPEKPGRYVSHWRLASPNGPKFGHRVWVVIQVVSKERNTPARNESVDSDTETSQEEEATEETPLLAAESRDAFVKASHEAIEQPEGKITYPEVDTSSFVDISEPFSGLKMSKTERNTEVGVEVPVVVSEVKEVRTEDLVQEYGAAVENSELGGFSMVEMPSNGNDEDNSAPITPRVEVEVSPSTEQDDRVEGVEESDEEELNTPERMSLKLESMGFKDRILNVDLLIRNKLDIRRTLDDLVMAADWAPILEELEEMGFLDTEMNRYLMFKNNGSVKRVVKELVQIYKDPAGQGKAKALAVE